MELLQLFVNVGSRRGVADVRVDFAFEGDADAHRLEVAMMDVGGDDSTAARYFAADQFGVEFFAFRDVGHLFCDEALPREMYLRNIASVGSARDTISAGLGRLGFSPLNPVIT